MTNSTTDPTPRFAPLTALLIGLMGAGLSYIVTQVALGIQFLNLEPSGINVTDTGEFEPMTLADWLGYSEIATVVVAVVIISAGVVGFVALKRSDRLSNLTLSTLIVGVALAPVIGIGVYHIVHGLAGR